MTKRKTIEDDKYSQYMMTADGFINRVISRTGQERAARRLLLKSGKFCPEQIAVMTRSDVAEEMSKRYLVLYTVGEKIALVKPDDIQEVLGKLEFLDI